MTTEINRNQNESSHILMYMIIEECDHIRCKDNNDNINIENDIDKIKVTTVILLFYDYYCLISCYCLMISIISSL